MRISSGIASSPWSAIKRIRWSDRVQSGWRVIGCSFLGRLSNAKDTPNPAASGDGLLRKYRTYVTPSQDAPYTGSLNDGATVFLVEGIMDSDGVVWWKVQLQDGTFGYIKEQYLR